MRVDFSRWTMTKLARPGRPAGLARPGIGLSKAVRERSRSTLASVSPSLSFAESLTPIGPETPTGSTPKRARAASSSVAFSVASAGLPTSLRRSSVAGAPKMRPLPVARRPVGSPTTVSAPFSNLSLPISFSATKFATLAFTNTFTSSPRASGPILKSSRNWPSTWPLSVLASSGMAATSRIASRASSSETASTEPATRMSTRTGVARPPSL